MSVLEYGPSGERMQRTLQADDIAGIRAFAVNAKDVNARHFYEPFGFVPARTDAFHLFLLMKEIKRDV